MSSGEYVYYSNDMELSEYSSEKESAEILMDENGEDEFTVGSSHYRREEVLSLSDATDNFLGTWDCELRTNPSPALAKAINDLRKAYEHD